MELVSATKVESGKEVEVIEWVNYNQTNKQTNKKKKKKKNNNNNNEKRSYDERSLLHSVCGIYKQQAV